MLKKAYSLLELKIPQGVPLYLLIKGKFSLNIEQFKKIKVKFKNNPSIQIAHTAI